MSVKDDTFILAAIAIGAYVLWQKLSPNVTAAAAAISGALDTAAAATGGAFYSMTGQQMPAQGSSLQTSVLNSDGSLTQVFSDGTTVVIPPNLVDPSVKAAIQAQPAPPLPGSTISSDSPLILDELGNVIGVVGP